jgi:fructose/tagatose bisphosphate aldolase
MYKEARELGYVIPGLGVENTDTMECILEAAVRKSEQLGVPDLPICIGFTGNYPERRQLTKYSSQNSVEQGLLAVGDDLKRLLRPGSRFASLRVHAHYDHGQPGIDEPMFEIAKEWMGSVMFDASTLSLTENRELTRKFVEEHGKDFLVEGCVDGIPEQGKSVAPDDQLTQPADARRFLDETGVDLIVVNVGTEHRVTKDKVRYHRDRARAIGEVAKGRMVLHGTSSLGDAPLSILPEDGFARFNLWTAMEKTGGWAVARGVITDIGRMLPTAEVRKLVEEGWLGPKALENLEGPDLDYLTHEYRRDRIWKPALLAFIDNVLGQCCFEKLRDR